MTTRKPETLTELLKTLERSGDLRSLARECGLSVRELRRRLSIWRRELVDDEAQVLDPLPVEANRGKTRSRKEAAKKNPGIDEWPELSPAATLAKSPLPARGKPVLEIFTDGASRGNPGPASIGVVFRMKDGEALAEHCETIGRATNNVAEYRAVVAALEHCQRWQVKRVLLNMDSELIVRQLHGTYRVKSPDLRPLYQQVVFLSKGLDEFRVQHIKRALNGHADALANRALDAD
ncbi:MAG: ribonuclease HI family protein [Candidatus Krumholzibacteria bacterium]|nr:ribonuclease HI family protein [Candidatus Krumholzibacteria bacterium]